MSTDQITDPRSILDGAIFQGSGVADPKRSESRGGCNSSVKMSAVKASRNFTLS